ncbi:MAG: hypothetical protein EBU32_12055, partial [Opitutaceae bacterium]|nr:hypothetical protein [Opitutaceae bacterium]
VPIHGLWTPHTVTLVLGLAAKHRPLPALFDYAVTVNPQRRAVLGAAARRISRWFRARSFLSKCDAIFDAFEKVRQLVGFDQRAAITRIVRTTPSCGV